jgi:hypothetical protein
MAFNHGIGSPRQEPTMSDPARASGNSAPSTNRAQGAAPANADARATSPQAAEAKKAIDASRQGGVVNPGELSKDVAKAYAQDRLQGAALHAAVNEQLSPRDQASLDEHLSATLGAVAGARAVDATTTRSFPSADAAARDALNKANPRSVQDNLEYGGLVNKDPKTGQYTATAPRVGTADGFQPGEVGVPKGQTTVGDYHTHGDYSVEGPDGKPQRTSQPALDQYGANRFSDVDIDGIRQDARGKPEYKGYLGTPSGEYRRFDPATDPVAKPATESGKPMGRQPSAAATSARAAGNGALVGAATDAVLSTGNALRDGRVSGDEAHNIVANSARGAVVGGTYAVTEQGLVKLADRTTGVAIERSAATAAARLGAADAGAVGAATRTVVTRLGGAGAAGAVIGAGVSIYENRDGLARGDSQAIGRVAGDTAVAAGAALSGAAAGALIGSVVPGVGTAVGAVVGLGVGFAADYVMRAGGVDKAIGHAVASGVDAVKGAASTVAGWFGW